MRPEQSDQAGQYVLGLMSLDERRAFEADLAIDAELADAVAKLERHLNHLDDTVSALPPNSALWRRIEANLDSVSAAKPAEIVKIRPHRNARVWQPFALAASVLVALGIGYLTGNSVGTSGQPQMIAVLISEQDATPGAIVEAFADNSVRIISLEDFSVPAGQVLQVWTLPDANTGPVSLGTFTDPSTLRLTGPDLPAPHVGQLYEITVEPSPGSPTGRPTGPILVKGYAKPPI